MSMKKYRHPMNDQIAHDLALAFATVMLKDELDMKRPKRLSSRDSALDTVPLTQSFHVYYDRAFSAFQRGTVLSDD